MFAANCAVARPTPTGQYEISGPGTYFWTCPANVYFVHGVIIAPGGNFVSGTGGGNGGALAWKNNIPVVPGTQYTIYIPFPVGAETAALAYFISTSVLSAEQGKARGGGALLFGDGGGKGGIGGVYGGGYCGGGGAAGYTGDGGSGGSGSSNTSYSSGAAGTGGGAGGGSGGTSGDSRSGGGTGLKGQGANGAGGYGAGGGGSGGANGTTNGGDYGGGGSDSGGSGGGKGGFRSIWGPNRAYPSTNTGDM